MCLITLCCVISASAYAQAPVIDHLWIDDPTGTLTIVGSFGRDSGSILIDSVQPRVKHWSADTIICTIPDSGRGSCGPVLVLNSHGKSEGRLLTEWWLWASFGTFAINGGGSKTQG